MVEFLYAIRFGTERFQRSKIMQLVQLIVFDKRNNFFVVDTAEINFLA